MKYHGMQFWFNTHTNDFCDSPFLCDSNEVESKWYAFGRSAHEDFRRYTQSTLFQVFFEQPEAKKMFQILHVFLALFILTAFLVDAFNISVEWYDYCISEESFRTDSN